MNAASAGVAPKLLGRGEDADGRRWMLTEWHGESSRSIHMAVHADAWGCIDRGSLAENSQRRLAELVAELHLAPASEDGQASRFGFQ